jgi:hypothetical protein
MGRTDVICGVDAIAGCAISNPFKRSFFEDTPNPCRGQPALCTAVSMNTLQPDFILKAVQKGQRSQSERMSLLGEM